jgi:glycosyltransferase involved in cell wall biosynthesis
VTASRPIIGINLLYLLPGVVGGTETYARELLGAMGSLANEFGFRVFLNREAHAWELPGAEAFERVVCPVNASSRAARYGWEQIGLRRMLASRPVDLLHSMGYTGPIGLRIPTVVTVHDLNFLRHRDMGPVRKIALGTVVRLASREAARVVTVSSFSRREIVSGLGIPESRVVVTPLAAEVKAEPTADDMRRARERYGLPERYLLAFGSVQKHKNLGALVQAFGRICGSLSQDLVLAGHLPPELAATAPSGGRVRTIGFVAPEDLAALLFGGDLLVFPSVYEGFGLPLLNAQALGVPVVASSAGALPEVGGVGALYFDPSSVEDMAGTIRRALASPAETQRLIRAGRENASRYDWADTARSTLGMYRSILGIPEPSPVASHT